MNKFKTGDSVIVLKGRSKGHVGSIKRIIDHKKVIVEGANVVKKHQKPNPRLQQSGGIIDFEAPMDISNVAIYNDVTSKKDKVKIKEVDGKRKRFYASTDEQIDA